MEQRNKKRIKIIFFILLIFVFLIAVYLYDQSVQYRKDANTQNILVEKLADYQVKYLNCLETRIER